MRDAGTVTYLRRDRPEVNDETLRQCSAGNSDAERIFVKVHEQRIARFLYGRIWPRPTHEDLEDLTQEVFLRAFDRRGSSGIGSFVPQSDGGEGKVSAWLFEIAKNVAIDRHRKQTRQIQTVTLEKADDAPSSASPQRDRERAESRRAIEEAMANLSEEHREVLLLCVLEGKSYKEVSEICGIPENTVKSRLFRAREGVRRYVKGNTDEEGESKDG